MRQHEDEIKRREKWSKIIKEKKKYRKRYIKDNILDKLRNMFSKWEYTTVEF